MKRIAKIVLLGALISLVLIPATSSHASAQEDCNFDGCKDVLFVAEAEVVSGLPMVDPTRPDVAVVVTDAGPNGGQCYEKVTTEWVWVEDPEGGGYYSLFASTDPCGYEVVCVSHRADVITPTVGGDDEQVGLFLSAATRAGEDVWGLPASWIAGDGEPQAESLIQVSYCMAHEEGGPAEEIGGLQPWGVTYTPTWEWVNLVDEIADPTATADQLWALIEDPEIEMGSAPPFEITTFVRAPSWVWLEAGSEPEPVASMNPSETAVLMVRAIATETVWDFGESSESVVSCPTDQLVQYNENIHDGRYPDDYGACYWTYLHTCFDDTESVVNSQCGTSEGYELMVTITFEGEQALVTRPNTDEEWPEPVWEPFAATETVTSPIFTVPVREILSLNG